MKLLVVAFCIYFLYLFLIPHEINTCVTSLYIPFLAFGLRRIGLFYKSLKIRVTARRPCFYAMKKEVVIN